MLNLIVNAIKIYYVLKCKLLNNLDIYFSSYFEIILKISIIILRKKIK